MSDVAAIVLAAGQGTRFGAEPKLLARFKGKPLVRHVAEAATAAIVEPVIVITGGHADHVEAALKDLPVRPVRNPRYAEGLSTSVRAGFASLPPEAQAAVILLGDMPLVTGELINGLIAAWKDHGMPAAVIPVAGGRRGNPVLIARRVENSIHGLTGDRGANALLRGYSDVLEWPISDSAVLQDVDTQSALRSLG